jgi:hypothetical protein
VSTLEWSEWNAGLVVPTEVGAVIASREQRQPRPPEPFDETEHEPFGEPPTLAGYVEPDALDRRPPPRPHEDPLWLDWDPGDEPDGTDPSDKDFLFGVLVEGLGRIARREDRLHTIALTFRRALPPLAIDDIHAALNAARPHRIQYLVWRHRRDDAVLTARAYPPELERRAAELLPALPPGAGRFYRARTPAPRARLVRRALIAALLLGGAALATAAAIEAIDYSPTYAERMRQQEGNDGQEE